jgi:5-methylcytosine-specific restriction enzyme A
MPNGRWAGSRRREQLPPDWPQRCQLARQLYGTACYKCGHANAVDTDHVQRGNDHRPQNLRPICGAACPQCAAEHRTPCHLAKSASEGGRAAAAARPPRKRPPEQHPGIRR